MLEKREYGRLWRKGLWYKIRFGELMLWWFSTALMAVSWNDTSLIEAWKSKRNGHKILQGRTLVIRLYVVVFTSFVQGHLNSTALSYTILSGRFISRKRSKTVPYHTSTWSNRYIYAIHQHPRKLKLFSDPSLRGFPCNVHFIRFL